MIKTFSIFLSVLTLASAPCFAQQQTDQQQRESARAQDTADESVLPKAQVSKPNSQSNPSYLQNMEDQDQQERGAEQAERAQAAETYPADEPTTGRSQTAQGTRPADTQLSFFEITPLLGAISIEDKSAFTVGSNLSFRISQNSPLFFEPSLMVSFLSGDNNQNGTLFHVDGGLRLDWIIEGSPVIPFVKGALGPTLSSSNDITINGENVSDSYFNAFAGGGLKVLINPRIAARVDTGVTFQGTNPGLYVLGAIALPL